MSGCVKQFFAKEPIPMKIDFKKIVCFGLIAAFNCLSAQEGPADDRQEISMTMANEQYDRCISPEDCKGETFGIEPYRRVDEYDYDVYTVGSECEREACEEKRICEKRECCPKKERECCPKKEKECCPKKETCKPKECAPKCKKSNCGNSCHRKGAAKVAQE